MDVLVIGEEGWGVGAEQMDSLRDLMERDAQSATAASRPSKTPAPATDTDNQTDTVSHSASSSSGISPTIAPDSSSASKRSTGTKLVSKGFRKGFLLGGDTLMRAKVNLPQQQKSDAPVLHDVQEAMKRTLDEREWLTPDLLQRVMSDPVLQGGLQNPRYTAALAEMSALKDTSAVEKYKHDEGLSTFLKQFMAVMGEHFVQLGDSKAKGASPAAAGAAPVDAGFPGLKMVSTTTTKAALSTAAIDPDVQRVLADPEIVQLLQDTAVMAALAACRRDPRELQRLLVDPTMAKKLRKLAQAGLVRFE